MNLQRCALLVVVSSLCVVACGADDGPTGTAANTPPIDLLESAVQVVANGCKQSEVHGAGLMVAPGKIATVAHVVAGAEQIEVRSSHGTSDATVVYFDPILDVAVLDVDPSLASPIAIGNGSAGDRGKVVVYRDGPVELPVEIKRLVDIRTADIYGEGTHIRPGYELGLDIRAGDSGAVVVIDDKAVALVWATSRQAEARAWAMRTTLIADHLSADTAVDHGKCA